MKNKRIRMYLVFWFAEKAPLNYKELRKRSGKKFSDLFFGIKKSFL